MSFTKFRLAHSVSNLGRCPSFATCADRIKKHAPSFPPLAVEQLSSRYQYCVKVQRESARTACVHVFRAFPNDQTCDARANFWHDEISRWLPIMCIIYRTLLVRSEASWPQGVRWLSEQQFIASHSLVARTTIYRCNLPIGTSDFQWSVSYPDLRRQVRSCCRR